MAEKCFSSLSQLSQWCLVQRDVTLALSLNYPPLLVTAPCNRLITHRKCVLPPGQD